MNSRLATIASRRIWGDPVLRRFNDFLGRINVSLEQRTIESKKELEILQMQIRVRNLPSPKTSGFASKLEEEITLAAIKQEQSRQHVLQRTLKQDPVLEKLFVAATTLLAHANGNPVGMDATRVREECAMDLARKERALLDELRDPDLRKSYMKVMASFGGPSEHERFLIHLLDSLE
jgi:hypothetical protein